MCKQKNNTKIYTELRKIKINKNLGFYTVYLFKCKKLETAAYQKNGRSKISTNYFYSRLIVIKMLNVFPNLNNFEELDFCC